MANLHEDSTHCRVTEHSRNSLFWLTSILHPFLTFLRTLSHLCTEKKNVWYLSNNFLKVCKYTTYLFCLVEFLCKFNSFYVFVCFMLWFYATFMFETWFPPNWNPQNIEKSFFWYRKYFLFHYIMTLTYNYPFFSTNDTQIYVLNVFFIFTKICINFSFPFFFI